jgi:hypothetical protein
MWPLEDSPQLSPYFKVTFEWCQKKKFLILKSWLRSLNQGDKKHLVTYSASPLRHAKKAVFSFLSNSSVVIVLFQVGLRGTRSLFLFSSCFLTTFSSSWSERRYGLWEALVVCWMILTFLLSDRKYGNYESSKKSRTGSEFCSSQFSGVQKFIKVSFLCNRF